MQARPFDFLKTLPDAVRQALIAETLDLVTYRFDAWATSLAARRLARLRRSTPNGIRLGGYGWVEDLRRQAPLQEVSPLPANTTGPLYRSEANKGYVQAPSLTHAATAAVLRSGYLSHQQMVRAETVPLRSISLPIVCAAPHGCWTESARGNRSQPCWAIGSSAVCTNRDSTAIFIGSGHWRA